MNSAASEREKYQTVWDDPAYRVKCHGLDLWKERRDIFPQTIGTALDIGCGTGRLFDHLNESGIDCWAIDISSNCLDVAIMDKWSHKFVECPIWEMEWMRPFDLGICTDVMEHLPEHHVVDSLELIYRACKITIFKIANFPSRSNGYNLHLTRKGVGWWMDQMECIGGKAEQIRYQTLRDEFLIRWS